MTPKPRTRSAICSLFALLLVCLPSLAQAQLVLGGDADEEAPIPASQEPADALRGQLEAEAGRLLLQLNRLQTQTNWNLERLERRRGTLEQQERRWAEQRNRISARWNPKQHQKLTALRGLSREVLASLQRAEEAYDERLQRVLDAMADVRLLELKLDESPVSSKLSMHGVERLIEQLQVEIQRRKARLDDLAQDQEKLRQSVERRRRELRALRGDMLDRDLASEREAEMPEGEGESPVGAHEPIPLTEKERALLDLSESERRMRAMLIEREGDLDRLHLQILEIEDRRLATALPVLRHRRDRWEEHRAELASREAGGLFNVSSRLLDPAAMALAGEHSARLLIDPAGTVSAVAERLALSPRAASSEDVDGRLLLAGLLGLLALLALRPIRPLIAAMEADGLGENVARAALLAALPLLPVTLLCGVIAWMGAVPPLLRSLYHFSALAPPVLAALLAASDVLFPSKGSPHVRPAAARYLRGLVRGSSALASLVLLGAALLPVFGYPDEVTGLVQGALVGVLLLAWLGILLRKQEILALLGVGHAGGGPGVFRAGIARFYSVLALGPVAVYGLFAIGYVNLARFLISGGTVTLATLLITPWLQQRLLGLVARAVGYPGGGGWLAVSAEGSRAAYRSIAPVLLLLVGGGALGLIAAGWGYGGLFGNLSAGMSYTLLDIGGSQISLGSLLLLALTAVLTWQLTRWVSSLLDRYIYPIYDLDRGMKATADTLAKWAVFGLGIFVGLDVVGVGTGFLAVFGGVFALGLGFGSQTLAANFISGLILLLARPVAVDHTIEVAGVVGRVEKIGSYSTVLVTLDNLKVIIPNSALIGTEVINWSLDDARVRLPVVVGVAYGSDVKRVQDLLLEAAAEDDRVLLRPAPVVRFDDFGDSALMFTLLLWAEDPSGRLQLASDVRFSIDRLFRENGIEIPFPQRVLHLPASSREAILEQAEEAGFEVRAEDGTLLMEGERDRQRGA